MLAKNPDFKRLWYHKVQNHRLLYPLSILLQKLENKYNHSATLLDKNIEDQRVELINAISDLTTKMDDR